MTTLRTIPVDSFDDPRLDPYRNQRDAWLRAAHNPDSPSVSVGDDGLFMAEGVLVIRALLHSRFPTHSILATPERLPAIEADVAARAPQAPIYLAPRPLLERIVGFDLHRGLLAAGHRLPPPPAADLIADTRLLVLAEDLSNHDNVGGLFRTVAALLGPGAGVLLSPRTCDPLYRKALRVSMGHALTIPFATLEPWPEALSAVARAGFRILALSPAAPTSAHRLSIGARDRVAVLVGAEGPGLSPETLSNLGPAVEPVAIPMHPGVDSLNVVVALGIVLDRVAQGLGPAHPGPAGR